MGLFQNNSSLRLKCLIPKQRFSLMHKEVDLSARLFPMDQPVRKHKTFRHPAGCYCCQFRDNKWFSAEQNSKLLFRRAIRAVDTAYWHAARVNITYCISFHSELSSGQSTTTGTVKLCAALEEFSWMIEKHFNYIFKHITHCALTSQHSGV